MIARNNVDMEAKIRIIVIREPESWPARSFIIKKLKHIINTVIVPNITILQAFLTHSIFSEGIPPFESHVLHFKITL